MTEIHIPSLPESSSSSSSTSGKSIIRRNMFQISIAVASLAVVAFLSTDPFHNHSNVVDTEASLSSSSSLLSPASFPSAHFRGANPHPTPEGQGERNLGFWSNFWNAAIKPKQEETTTTTTTTSTTTTTTTTTSSSEAARDDTMLVMSDPFPPSPEDDSNGDDSDVHLVSPADESTADDPPLCDTATHEGCPPGQLCWTPPSLYCPPSGCRPMCTCNPSSSIGAADSSAGILNGCDDGLFCRNPCAMADAGPECFQDEMTRDCAEWGANFMCDFDNGGGCAEKTEEVQDDGTTACPQDVFQCPDGSYVARDPKYDCQFSACDGDNGGMVQNGGTLIPMVNAVVPDRDDGTVIDADGGECVSGKFHPPLVPTAYTCTNDLEVDPTWPEEGVFFETAEECCAVFGEDGTGYCQVIDVCAEADGGSEGDVPCEEKKFHPNHETGVGCTNSQQVDGATWKDMADFYFDTPEECCSLFANDDGSCTIVDVCADGDGVQPDDTGDGGNNDVVVGEGVCEDLKFHPNHQTGIGCSNSQNVAGAPWENNSLFYYDTVEECCAQFSNEDGTCDVYDICTMPPTTTTSTTTTSTTTTTTTTTATTATTSTTTTEEPTTTTVPPTTTTEAATTTTTTDEPTTPKPTTTMGATTTAAAATTTAAAATTVPATATNPTCSQLPFHPPVPVVAFTCTNAIYSGDFLQPKHFFDSAEACCAAVANLQTGYCNVIDVCVEGEGEVEMKCEERKFHPNHVTGIGCTNSYEVEGATWKDIGDFYKETGEECCAFFGGGMECPIVDVCETDTASTAVTATTTTTSTAAATSVEPTTVPPTTTEATTTTESATTATTIPADCDQRPFHPHKDIIHTCTNSGDVEPYWSSALLFDSSEACCSMFKNSNDGSCDVIDVCKPTTTAVATTAPGDLACQDYKFHPGKEEGSGCTNSLDISDEMESVPHFFFDTAEECCDVFANPDTGACPIVDVCSEPPTTETPNGDTEMWYPDILNQAYTVGVCINILPVPESLDAFVYDSNLECCEEFYTDQSSGACLAAIASEKTTTTSTTTSTTIEEKTSTTTAVNVVQSDPPQCPGDQCLSPEGVCEDTYFCAINPCDLEPCRPDQECSSNFCGGCHHVCTDKTGVVYDAGTSTSTTTSATVVTTNTQERTDPTTARTSTTTSAATSTASKTTTPDPVTITTPTATTTVPGIKPGNCTTNRWHMSTLVGATYTCTNDDVYPEAWLAMEWRHFYDTATDCCQAFYGELPCTVDDICTRDKCAEKWHVSLTPGEEYTCTNSHDFLEQWDASYFYDSADECCLGYFDSPCNQVDTCSYAEPEATSCVDYWHPKPQSNACTNSGDHPEYWPDTMRYANAEDCCQGYFQSTCEQIDECISSDISSTSSTVPVKTTVPPTTLAASTTSSSAATTTSTTTTTTTSTTTEILTSSPTRNPTQSPSSSPTSTPTTTPTKFPTNAPTEVPTKTPTNAPTNTPTNAPTNTPTNAPTNTPTNAPTNTPTSEPTHNPTPIPTKKPTPLPTRNPTPVPTNKPTPVPQPFSSLSNGIDDFEDYYSTNGTPVDIPWNYGNPKQWVLDSSKKYSGSKSLVSIKPEGLGETSMLSLRITTTKWSILQCKIWVDTAMPWELFYVEVNGEQRNTYYQPSGEWISLVTGFDAGNNDIKFMVKNNDFYIGAPRNGPEDGSGRVWLDDCEIIPTGR